LYFCHDVSGSCVGEIYCSAVIGLFPAIFGGELVKAASVYTNDDPGVGQEIVGCLEVADVLESVGEDNEMSGLGMLQG